MPENASLWTVARFYQTPVLCPCPSCQQSSQCVSFTTDDGLRYDDLQVLYPQATVGQRYCFDAQTKRMEPLLTQAIEVEL